MSFVPINPAAYAARPVRTDPMLFPYSALRRQHQAQSSGLKDDISNDLPADLPICSVNKDIVVRLKWGETEYKGRLVSTDSYMNIQLTNAQEFIDQKFTSDLGQILIRCNNVLWIKAADAGEGGDVTMEG